MIQEAAKALWAVNETTPRFQVTALHPDGPDLMLTSNISGSPLFIARNEDGEYMLVNESEVELFRSRGLREVVVQACATLYHDWLVARLLD
jgi:hypothetical protein